MITHHKSSDWVGTKIMHLRTARQTDDELGGGKKRSSNYVEDSQWYYIPTGRRSSLLRCDAVQLSEWFLIF